MRTPNFQTIKTGTVQIFDLRTVIFVGHFSALDITFPHHLCSNSLLHSFNPTEIMLHLSAAATTTILLLALKVFMVSAVGHNAFSEALQQHVEQRVDRLQTRVQFAHLQSNTGNSRGLRKKSKKTNSRRTKSAKAKGKGSPSIDLEPVVEDPVQPIKKVKPTPSPTLFPSASPSLSPVPTSFPSNGPTLAFDINECETYERYWYVIRSIHSISQYYSSFTQFHYIDITSLQDA